MVGTNDLEKSNKFYEPIMKLLGLKQVSITDKYIGFGHQKDNEVKFYITKPHNKEKASFGNGTGSQVVVLKDVCHYYHCLPK